MKSVPAIMLLLLVLPLAHALFLVGDAGEDGRIPILCEQQESVFVSSPDGKVSRLALDTSFQAEFLAPSPGPYTVQCGNQTSTVFAGGNTPGKAADAADEISYSLLLWIVALSLASLLAAALLIIGQAAGKTVFRKTVEGRAARLSLKAGSEMDCIEIEDPVAFGYSGERLHFSIPKLQKGAEWSWEYEIGAQAQEGALPASLSAEEGGRGISMLSELFIEGRKGAAQGSGAAAGAKRKLPKIEPISADDAGKTGAQKRKLPKAK